jgi:hypothetical protein
LVSIDCDLWAEDDVALGKGLTYGLEKRVASLEIHYVPNCGHWVQNEAVEEVNQTAGLSAGIGVSAAPGSVELPSYRLPARFVAPFLASMLLRRPRSFARDSALALTGLRPEPEVLGAIEVPAQGPCLVACNHYGRPGFGAWWFTFAIQAAIAARRAPAAPRDVHWVMAAAWTYPSGSWQDRILTPLSFWAFRRVAGVYGFVNMPPMPPRPFEVEARAVAVRRTLRLAQRAAREGGMVGLAPQGGDVVHLLDPPPEGVGEFIALLVQAGLPVLPVGVAEQGGRLRVSFGALFWPSIPPRRQGRDEAVSEQVMAAIGRQLPA